MCWFALTQGGIWCGISSHCKIHSRRSICKQVARPTRPANITLTLMLTCTARISFSQFSLQNTEQLARYAAYCSSRYTQNNAFYIKLNVTVFVIFSQHNRNTNNKSNRLNGKLYSIHCSHCSVHSGGEPQHLKTPHSPALHFVNNLGRRICTDAHDKNESLRSFNVLILSFSQFFVHQ